MFMSSIVAEYEGIQIASLRGDGAAFASEISDALAFLHKHDPRRFKMVRTTTDLIVERTLPCGQNSGEYRHGLRATSIDYTPLNSTWDDCYRHAFFAGLIIHEATHGRIREFGIVTTKENRIQVERICIAEENRFHGRIGHLRESLAEDLHNPFEAARWDSIWNAGPLDQLWMSLRRAYENDKWSGQRR